MFTAVDLPMKKLSDRPPGPTVHRVIESVGERRKKNTQQVTDNDKQHQSQAKSRSSQPGHLKASLRPFRGNIQMFARYG